MKNPERMKSDPAGFAPVWPECSDLEMRCFECALNTTENRERCVFAECAAYQRPEWEAVVFHKVLA